MTNGRIAGATRSVKGYLKANASVAVRIGGFECTLADRSILIARGVVKERVKTDCCVVHPGGDVKQSLRAFSGVEAGIASIWRRGRQGRLRAGRKPKADEHQRDEKYWSSFF